MILVDDCEFYRQALCGIVTLYRTVQGPIVRLQFWNDRVEDWVDSKLSFYDLRDMRLLTIPEAYRQAPSAFLQHVR